MTLIKLGFIVAGLLLTGAAWWSARMNARAADWPGVPGVIVRSEFNRAHEGDNDSLRIEYEYHVGGVLQRGSTLSYIGLPAGGDAKAALAARYPVGLEVTVYHDPAEPGRAVLEREASRAWIAPALMGLALVGLGLFKDL